jgi:hypothetical protein
MISMHLIKHMDMIREYNNRTDNSTNIHNKGLDNISVEQLEHDFNAFHQAHGYDQKVQQQD